VLACGLVAFVVASNVSQVNLTNRAASTVPRAAAPSPTPPSMQDVGRDALTRVVTVEAERTSDESLGTGWLIDSHCDYVTNAHVVHGEQAVRITDRTDHVHDAVVAGIDEADDIAVVHCTDGYSPGAPLPLDGNTINTSPLAVVVIASSRATGQNDITLETITAVHQDVPLASTDQRSDPSAPTLYHDMLDLTGNKVYQGNSGGPLLDPGGRVVGILTLSNPDIAEAYAIPLSRVLAELTTFEAKA